MTSDGRTGRVHWGYALAGLCLAVLATFQSDRGSAVWAMVFGLAALGNAYLSIRPMLPTRFGGEARPEVRRSASTAAPSRPLPEEMRQALKAYEPRMRSWLAIAVAGWAVAVGVVLLTPPFGLAGAALSLFATHRYLRYRRSVKILRRALVAISDETPKNAGQKASR